MNKTVKMIQLVRQASIGDKENMEKLVEVTRPVLFSYLYRLTMDYHLAEDLLQQVQTEMVMSLWRLQKPDRFWPWIYKHAWGAVQHHYREVRKRREISYSQAEQTFYEEQLSSEKVQSDSFFENIDKKKLFETVCGAMKNIPLRQRSVLTMRCYNDMTFQEIGDMLECSETNARVLFFRAQKRIKSKLRQKGFRANGVFLPALGLFGTITSKSATTTTPAIISVSESSIQVGFLASMIGTLTSKIGLLLTGILTTILTWLTAANILLIALIALLCLPIIIAGLYYSAFCE